MTLIDSRAPFYSEHENTTNQLMAETLNNINLTRQFLFANYFVQHR